ncbi:MAG: efflux RND transporter periplasmic adaptor subunit [Nevskiales bacterium]
MQTIDNQVDAGTGTVKLRALFDNKDFGLFPNQLVNAHLQIESLHDVVVVPASAVRRDTHGAYVYLIKAGETVTLQPVSLGPLEGDRQAISMGVEPGDRVVTSGTYQLREGAKVSSAEGEVEIEADAGDPPSDDRHF